MCPGLYVTIELENVSLQLFKDRSGDFRIPLVSFFILYVEDMYCCLSQHSPLTTWFFSKVGASLLKHENRMTVLTFNLQVCSYFRHSHILH